MWTLHFFSVLCLLITQIYGKVAPHISTLNMPQSGRADNHYTAAVVEFAPVESLTDPPSLILATNMDSYQDAVRRAQSMGADIIVFPEYGLTSTLPSDNRSLAREFAQVVPSPEENLNPCNAYNNSMEFETMRRLSCYAKDNSIYLVANLIEMLPCQGCANDDVLLYNTNVALDRFGNLVARYRKFNLFAEFALNQTEEADISIFLADFGAKFGLITCFDIMFEHPAVTLVTQYNVTDIIFPTAWIQELPFLTGVQTQMMWSYALDINLLGSGYNKPSSGQGGSGIYNGKSGVIIETLPWESTSQCLIAEVPKTDTIINNNNKITPPYYYQEDLTNYTTQLINLNNKIEQYQLCSNDLCCNFEISAQIFDSTVFRIIAYSGERSYGGGYYVNKFLQTCGVIRCKHPDDPVKNCALIMHGIAENVTINHLKINGNFSQGALIGPNIVNGLFKVLPGNLIQFDKVIGENSNDITLQLLDTIHENILTFALWGRVFPDP